MNNYASIMYKIKYEEFDEYIHNLNLHDISSVIRHIELGEELHLFKHKKQCIDYLKSLLDSGYTYKKFNDQLVNGIIFYGNDMSVAFTVCNIVNSTINFAGCSIDKIEIVKLKKNDDIVEFVKDKILNNEYIDLQKQHVDYVNNKLTTIIDTNNKDICVEIINKMREEELYKDVKNISYISHYSMRVFKNDTQILSVVIVDDSFKELSIVIQ